MWGHDEQETLCKLKEWSPIDPSSAGPDREDFRDLEALLLPAPNAMASLANAAAQVRVTGMPINSSAV
jgi:hypothetical protein